MTVQGGVVVLQDVAQDLSRHNQRGGMVLKELNEDLDSGIAGLHKILPEAGVDCLTLDAKRGGRLIGDRIFYLVGFGRHVSASSLPSQYQDSILFLE